MALGFFILNVDFLKCLWYDGDMKAKHIITTCGIILGGLAVAQSASAVVTYRDSTDVQFTFAPMLSLTLAGVSTSTDLIITNLAPGTTGISDPVTANVVTNNSAGYILSATVGGGRTELAGTAGTISMIDSSDSSLSSGTWGLTMDNGNTYKALSTSAGITLAQSDGPTGGATPVRIGAYAANDQAAGVYTNSINFLVTPKVATYTITAATGTGAATATIGGAATTTLMPGSSAALAATCTSGTFNRWDISGVGSVASETTASTTFTAGNGPATVTAYCN